MFRFEGHFTAQNNPDLPDSLPQVSEPHQQAGAAHIHDEQPSAMSASGNAAEAPEQTQGAESAGVSPAKPAARQTEASQRPESEFRRSHSPEFYDAKFRRYVLR